MPVDVEVDSEVIALLADERPVDVEVDSDVTVEFVVYNCDPLIASVLVAEIVPAARFVICLPLVTVTPFNEMPWGPYRVIAPAALFAVDPMIMYA
jgi:hypothetical protein